MQLKIKPSSSNTYPKEGFLIRSISIKFWIQQLQTLDIELENTAIYVVPSVDANSIWGCFVEIAIQKPNLQNLFNVELCQCLHNKIYIPEYSTITPLFSIEEAEKFFPKFKYLMHPDFGILALEEKINWSDLINLKPNESYRISKPAESIFIPKYIKKIEVKALPPEEMLKLMDEKAVPKKEKFEKNPLNLVEKIKLGLLRSLIKPKQNSKGNDNETVNPSFLRKILNQIVSEKYIEKMEHNLEDLEYRNSSELQKLMDLLKKNPEEALKYAIPLDSTGFTRGGNDAVFQMLKRWNGFGLFGNLESSNLRGGAILGDDYISKLQQQYNQTALDYIKQKNYEKAAFIYMKLLKNNYMAAKTLEDGKLYPEAASLYLKFLQNKSKAAECYEKGMMTSDAIKIYKELQQNEKVGDLYMKLNNKSEAFNSYNIVVEEYLKLDKYVTASLLFKNKMNNKTNAQELLIEGWRKNKDAFNCINNYFQNFDDAKELLKSIEHIYEKETTDTNKPILLQALKHEFKKEAISIRTKEIAYEIIANLALENPNIVTELQNFNKDKSLIKDISRYKNNNIV